MTTPEPSTPAFPLLPLVVGGADHIGLHRVQHLLQWGCDVGTLDKLSTAYRDALPYSRFVPGNRAERDALDALFSSRAFDAVAAAAATAQAHYAQKHVCKHASNGWASAKTGLLPPLTSNQPRTTVAP